MASGPEEAGRGIIEDAKGRIKEAAGTVAGDDKLKREGQAQQDKAAAARQAAGKEAQAEVHRASEQAAEARQRAAQKR